MTARPITEGERARALQIAKDIHEADAYALTQWLEECSITEVELVARALLSTASAVQEMREALELAEDVLSRSPFSTQMWPNGMHPNTGITLIRAALSLEGEDKQATRGEAAATAPTDRL